MSETDITVATVDGNEKEDLILLQRLQEAAARHIHAERNSKVPLHIEISLQPHAAAINNHLDVLRDHTIFVGTELLAVKKKLKGYHKDTFGNWLRDNFGWHPRTAQRYMKVSQFCMQHPEATILSSSAVCLLANSGTPSEVLAAVLSQLANGEKPKWNEIRNMIEKFKTSDPHTIISENRSPININKMDALQNPAYEVAEMILTQEIEDRDTIRSRLALIDAEELKIAILYKLSANPDALSSE